MQWTCNEIVYFVTDSDTQLEHYDTKNFMRAAMPKMFLDG